MQLNLNNIFTGVKSLLPLATEALSIINPGAGAAISVVSKIATEIDAAIPLAEDYLAKMKAIKAGYTQAQWDAFRASKQADDDAIMALQPTV
jgi:hypothetical protein